MQKRVLVVDDDSIVRRTVRRGLEQRGYQVTEAVDGQDAVLTILRNGPFGAIISDLEMPHVDGIDFLLELRWRKNPHAERLIFHTSNPERLGGLCAPRAAKCCLDSIEEAILQLKEVGIEA